MTEQYPPIVVLVGPTAVGKSAVAMEVAARVGAVIVCADSRQVYRYMDIGTVKPTLAERAAVRHEMLDLIEPSDTYSAHRYCDEGTRVLRRTAEWERPALVVGGTGYYIQALLDRPGVPSVPPNLDLRAALRREAGELGVGALHERLAKLDPASAARIHPNNQNRIVRALEVITALGHPVPPASVGRPIEALYIGLQRDRTELHGIVGERIQRQMAEGFLDEVRLLLAMGYQPTSPGLSGFGYSQMVAYLMGLCSLEEAQAEYEVATRQYIRRQMTWFRRDSRIHWLDAGDDVISRVMDLVTGYLEERCT